MCTFFGFGDIAIVRDDKADGDDNGCPSQPSPKGAGFADVDIALLPFRGGREGLPNRRRCTVVAAGDYVRAKTPLRSVFTLTSIAPTPLDVSFILLRLTSHSFSHRREAYLLSILYYLFTSPRLLLTKY
jgi:hypothetical protein